MLVGIPREVRPGERRVAATPETVQRLAKLGFQVGVEAGAGAAASFSDEEYARAGARIIAAPEELWAAADIILKVQPPERHPELKRHEAELLRDRGTLVCFLWPDKNPHLLERLKQRNATVIAVDQIPRITRAQKMDALSAMSNIAGYRAVIEAASFYGRFFTGQMTAAGKVPPARVLVIGAGVAGLAAIGAARGLGAIVRAFDTRPATRDQVHSMGAEFIEVELAEDGSGTGGYAREMSPAFIAAEMALFAKQAREVDIIITTALIPGKPAPVLITEEMVASMKRGSVIVDLAAESGGNCALTQPERVVEKHGVTIIGYVDLPSRLAPTASALYGNNLCSLLGEIGGAEKWHIDLADEVMRSAVVLHEGTLRWPPAPLPPAAVPAAPPKASHPPTSAGVERASADSGLGRTVALAAFAAAVIGIGTFAPAALLSHLTVFVLACFVGWQVVWNVTPALHTPLMSVTNAISGIIIVGGMLQLGGGSSSAVLWLGAAAVLLATINISGGFLVTQRMLRMFRK